MIVVVGTKAYEAYFAYTCVISWVQEQVILGELGGRVMDYNFLVCEILSAFQQIGFIESRCWLVEPIRSLSLSSLSHSN